MAKLKFNKKAFWITMPIVSLITIGAIAGGTAAVLINKKNNDTSEPKPPIEDGKNNGSDTSKPIDEIPNNGLNERRDLITVQGTTFKVEQEDRYDKSEVFYGADVLEVDENGLTKFYKKIPRLSEIDYTEYGPKLPSISWIGRYIQSLWTDDFRDANKLLKYSADDPRPLTKEEYLTIIETILSYLDEEFTPDEIAELVDLDEYKKLKRIYGYDFKKEDLSYVERELPWYIYFKNTELVGNQTANEKLYGNDSIIKYLNYFVGLTAWSFRYDLKKEKYLTFLKEHNISKEEKADNVDLSILKEWGLPETNEIEYFSDLRGIGPSEDEALTAIYKGREVRIPSKIWKLERTLPTEDTSIVNHRTVALRENRFNNEMFLSHFFYSPVNNIEENSSIILYDQEDIEFTKNLAIQKANLLQLAMYKRFLWFLKNAIALSKDFDENASLREILDFTNKSKFSYSFSSLFDSLEEELLNFIGLEWVPALTMEANEDEEYSRALIMPYLENGEFSYHHDYEWAVNLYMNFVVPMKAYFDEEDWTSNSPRADRYKFNKMFLEKPEFRENTEKKYDILRKFLTKMGTKKHPYYQSNAEIERKALNLVDQFKKFFGWKFSSLK